MIGVYAVATGDKVSELSGFTWSLFTVSWSPDGRSIAATGDDVARVWDATTGASRALGARRYGQRDGLERRLDQDRYRER